MTYFVGQTLVYIALTFTVALFFGWWLRGRGEGKARDEKPSMTGDGGPELEAIARQRNELQGRCGRLDKTIGELETELETARSRILSLEMEREGEGQAPSLRVKGDLQTTTMAGAVDPFMDPPSMLLDLDESSTDDLRRIQGLGKVLEMRLHELGISHFHQLAGLEGYDFNWLASKLGFTASRLTEMDWVGQARRLVAESATSDGDS